MTAKPAVSLAAPPGRRNAILELARKIEAEGFAPVPVSMSFGITSSAFGAQTLSELLDQADKALYASKEWGRNRVSRFDELPG